MHERSIMEALAGAVAALGGPDFGERLLGALHAIAGTDLCSAFAVGEDGALRYLFSAGLHPQIPDFAESASLAYARIYWRSDRTTRRTLARTGASDGTVHVIRQAWNGISDPDYRRACYERGGIVERLTLYGGGKRPLFASAYRIRGSGHSSPAELEALERAAPLLLALVARHAETSRAAAEPPAPGGDLTRRLLACDRALSEREAAVAAALVAGRSQREIAQAAGVALSSVITYRRRAYRKLGVADRRGLAEFLDQHDRRH